MALVLKDRVKVLATTTGTGAFTLGSAVTGYQDFSVIGDGNTTYYTIAAQATPDWEVGIGTYTASGTLLSRDTILESSNGGAAVDFPAGTKDVFVTYPAERAVYEDSAGDYPVQNTFGTLNAANAVLTAGTISTTPVNATDLVNKTYVDTIASSGVHFHVPVRVETPLSEGSLNATYNNGTSGVGATLTNAGTQVALVIDGVTVSVADRVLVYNQTNATQNGVYVVTDTGSISTNWVLTRSADTNTYGVDSPNSLSAGSTFFVTDGNTGKGETYTCNTTGVITFGTTNITFAQISSAQIYSAGTGLTLTNTTFSITDTGTAGTYGNASNVPVFTTNAQGQVTSATNTAIAIAAGAVSGLAASATTDTTNASNITSGTLGTSRLSGSYTGITGVGTLAAGTWNGSTIGATYGGTGLSSFAAGDIIYADSSTTLARLADTAVGNALISGGAAADPSWGKIGLATHVDGILPVANGGTGNATNQSASVANSATFNDGGSGAASGSTFNGSSPLTISYNTLGAYPTTNPAGYTSNTGTVTSVGGTGTVNGLTLTGTVTTSGNLTLGGTLSGIANAALTNSSVTVNGTSIALGASGTITANTPNALTFNNGGAGGASGTTYNGSSAITISYNTVGAPSTTGTGASGTWGISVSGNAATATTTTNLSGGTATATWVNTTQGLTDTSGTNSALRIASPGGASYSGDPVTGAFKITLPQSWTNTMLRMTIRVYTYDNGSFDIYCGGYNYQPTTEWVNTFAYMDSQTRGALNVRFGHDGTNCCIYIGETGTSWSYPKLYVTDFQAGHGNYAASQWRSGWSVSVVTSFGTITSTQSASKTITGQANSATITAATAATGNTILLRDGSGDATARYFFGTYFNQSSGNSENPTIGQFWTQNTSDTYVRKSTPAHVVNQLEVVSKLGSSYYQVNTWLQLNGGYGLYCPSINGAHFYPNTSSSYGEWATQGSRSGYSGITSTFSGVNGTMFDGAGNGGAYREPSGRWYYYYNVGNDCMGIGTSSTSSDYSLYVGKGLRAFTTIYTQGAVYGQNFYSWNDASYYLTPAGQSRLNNIVMVATNGSGNWAQSITHPDRGIYFINTSGSAIPCYFTVNSGGTLSGYIVTSGGTTQYLTSSDYRMKENVQDLDKLEALNKIMSVKPRTFNWLEAHGGKADFGFIAHELQEVAPECVGGEKDAVMPDGKIMPQGVDTTFLIPTLCAAIQKQQEMIEQLMAKVAVLEGV